MPCKLKGAGILPAPRLSPLAYLDLNSPADDESRAVLQKLGATVPAQVPPKKADKKQVKADKATIKTSTEASPTGSVSGTPK